MIKSPSLRFVRTCIESVTVPRVRHYGWLIGLVMLQYGCISTHYPPTEKYEPTWESLAQYETPEWFKDAKFGIWAHWGPQCQPMDGDWYARNMYLKGTDQYNYHVAHYGNPKEYGFKEVIRDWKVDNWQPDSLVKLYKECGAEYFMCMANHHDNFDLWDSSFQEWNSVRVGPHKDLVEGWCKAARRYGLPFGISIHASHAWTWYEPSQNYDGRLTQRDGKGKWWEGLDPQALYAQSHAHSRKSKNRNAIYSQWTWLNGASRPSGEYMAKFYHRTLEAIQRFQPDVVYFDDEVLPFYPYNEKVGLKIAAEYYNLSAKSHDGNAKCVLLGKSLSEAQKHCLTWDVERGIPDQIQDNYWQTCTCLGQWHYDLDTYREGKYKSTATIIYMLVDIISKNGNLLLNVPLRPDGTPDEKELAILHDLSAWMKVNAESIHGTRVWNTFGEGPTAENARPVEGVGFNEDITYSSDDVRYVTKNGVIYATLMGWPIKNEIVLKSFAPKAGYFKGNIQNVILLGYGEVSACLQNDGLHIILPYPHAEEPAIVFKIKG